MKKTFNLTGFALVSLAAVAAFASGMLDPILHLLGLQPDAALPLALLANAPMVVNKETIAEQIKQFGIKRQAAADAAEALVAKGITEGRTLDEHETEQHKGHMAEIAAIDSHLTLLKAHEATMVAKATPIVQGTGRGEGAVEIGGAGPISVRRNLPKGTAFVRHAMALAVAKGSKLEAAHIAEQIWKDTPEVALMLKAAVSAGTTSNATWAGPLVQFNDVNSEFIELLRPQTIIGRLNMRRIAFNSRVARQTTGTTGTFVGEGSPTPVKALGFDNITIPWAKASTISAFSVELERLAEPAIEEAVRKDLIDGIAQYLDRRLVDPAYPGVANVSPASLTYGVTPRSASGSTLQALDNDVRYVQTQFADNELSLQQGIWIMPAALAIRLSMMRTNQDNKAFPELSVNGGSFYGLPVIVSNNVQPSGSPGDQHLILIAQDEVYLADDGQVRVDVNPYAALEMNDAPSGGSTTLHSLWQNGEVGVKVDRWIYWTKRRSAAVQFIDKAQSYAS